MASASGHQKETTPEGHVEDPVLPPHFTVPGADEGPFHADNLAAIDQVEHLLHPELTSGDPESGLHSQREGLHDEEDSHYTTSRNFNWRAIRPVTAIKHVLSMALTLFSVVVVSAAIFTKQTTATGKKNLHPVFAFIVFWAILAWLALMEGALNCMVGLKPIDKILYSESHAKTYKITSLGHKGDNLERFIVGRQYLDLTSVFLTSFMVSTIDDASVLGLPKIVNSIFLDSGFGVILITIVFGQLISAINCAHYMLDWMNNNIMLATTYIALAVEASGILHAVYLAQIGLSYISGKPIESHEPPKTLLQKILFWVRVVMSVSITVLAFVVALTALFENKTTMWDSVPPVVSLLILVVLIFVGGLMESLQIALFAVVHLPPEQIERHPLAKYNCNLVFHSSSSNFQALLVGRQAFQTVIMFAFARITTIETREGEENLFGVGDGVQSFLDTGVMGALMATIVASLSWRVMASTFPMFFLANPLFTIIIRLCLAVEGTGICYSSWFFAYLQRRLMGFQKDELFIGTHQDRENFKAGKSGSPTNSSNDSMDKQDLSVSETSLPASTPAEVMSEMHQSESNLK